MNLQSTIIKELAKVINSQPEKKTTLYYGTIDRVVGSGENKRAYVHIDGSAEGTSTPVVEGTEVLEGDRVIVTIENHQAIVMSNVTSPASARTATNYMDLSELDEGLVIGELNNDGHTYNVLIKSDGVYVRDGVGDEAKVLAKYGGEGTILYDDDGEPAAQFTADGIIFYQDIDGYVQYDPVTGLITNAKINYADVENLDANYASIQHLNAATARIEDLEADNVVINGTLTAHEGQFDILEADNATIHGTLTAHGGRFDTLEADNATIHGTLTAHEGQFDILEAEDAVINGVLTATLGRIDTIEANYVDTDTLVAGYAEIDLANVNNAWIQNGLIKDAAITDAQILGVSANKLTAGTIDASEINVANLRAKNLIVEKMNGQPILGGYELVNKNSTGYSSKNPSTEGWYEYQNGSFIASIDTTVNSSKAYYRDGNSVALYDQTYIDGLATNLNQRIDGAVETFTGSVVPTLVTYPAADWTSAQMASHVGDIYYVINPQIGEDGYCYRFAFDNSTQTYKWILIKDSDVTAALANISDLQDFQSDTVSWIDETDEGIEIIRQNHTSLSGVVNKTVKESTQLWFTKANTTAPSAPNSTTYPNGVSDTSTTGNGWRTVVPTYDSSYPYYFYCWQYKFVDNTFGWSVVIYDRATTEAEERARTGVADAAAAQSTADSNIKSSVQLWRTTNSETPPSKPYTDGSSSYINSTSTSGDTWTTVVPTYNASYPKYHYCYQQQRGDGKYQWTSPVFDGATSEAMAKAQSALPASTFTTFESTTFQNLVDEVDEHSNTFTTMSTRIDSKADSSTVTTLSNTVSSVSQTATTNSTKLSNLTQTLGTNADGTTASNDIVHKYNTLESDLDGVTQRVGKTEAQIKGMYAVCDTAIGTADKVAVITPNVDAWEIYTGANITVKFINGNSAAVPTLSIKPKASGTGSTKKNIKAYTGTSNLTENEYTWKAGTALSFFYDGSYWRLQDSSLVSRVSLAESEIVQQAGQISLKVSETDITGNYIASKINLSGSDASISAAKINFQGVADFDSYSLKTNTVSDMVIEYAKSTDPTTFTPVSGSAGQWSTTVPTWTNDNTYIWQKVTKSKADGSTPTSIMTCIQGIKGDTGSSSYTYVRYSANSNGSNMVTTPTSDTKYIGVYTGTSSTVPAYTSFTWSKYVGEDGDPGDPGDPGTSYYTFVRYSANSNGSSMTTTPQTNSKYIGIYTGTSSSAPTAYTSYTWSQYRGNDGDTYYTYVRYSVNSNGNPMVETPTDSSVYIGIYTGTESTAPSSYSSYKWSRYRGQDGTSSQWYYGNKLVHTSGTASTATGITSAVVGDMYLNNETYSIYRCTTAGASGTAVWTYTGNLLSGLEDEIGATHRNLLRSGDLVRNKWINGSSGEQNSTKCFSSGYIPISASTKYTLQLWQPSNSQTGNNRAWTGKFLWYNSSKTYLSGYSSTYFADTHVTYTATSPSNAAYVRVTFQLPTGADVTPDTWNPFNTDYRWKLEVGDVASDWSLAPEDTLGEQQHIYIRTNSNSVPVPPNARVTNDTEANAAWTRLRLPMTDKNNLSYSYCYTCDQLIGLNGSFLGCTKVISDQAHTVIDGGNIITGTLTVGALDAQSQSQLRNDKYITQIDSDGIFVHQIDTDQDGTTPTQSSAYGIHISDTINIVKGGSTVASYGDTIVLGKNIGTTNLAEDSITDGSGNQLVDSSGNSIIGYSSDNVYAEGYNTLIDSTGLYIRNGMTNLAHYGERTVFYEPDGQTEAADISATGMHVKLGTIGGWTIDATKLSRSDGNNNTVKLISIGLDITANSPYGSQQLISQTRLFQNGLSLRHYGDDYMSEGSLTSRGLMLDSSDSATTLALYGGLDTTPYVRVGERIGTTDHYTYKYLQLYFNLDSGASGLRWVETGAGATTVNYSPFWISGANNIVIEGDTEMDFLLHDHTTSNGSDIAKIVFCENQDSNLVFRPEGNNKIYLGTSVNKWKGIYGVAIRGDDVYGNLHDTSSSDLKEKSILENHDWKIDEFIHGLKPIAFKWKEGSTGRIHMGFGAQDVAKLTKDLKIGDLSVYSAEVKTDGEFNEPYHGEEIEDSKLSWTLRYTELIAPMVLEIQRLMDRVKELEDKING